MRNDNYEDIIDLPHHVSETRPQMPVSDRAAQFAPFAALTGYDSAISETARLTDSARELDDGAKAALDERLRYLADASDSPVAVFTYFAPDSRKSGGAYVTVAGAVARVDEIARTVALTDGTVIPTDALRRIEGDVFDAEKWM